MKSANDKFTLITNFVFVVNSIKKIKSRYLYFFLFYGIILGTIPILYIIFPRFILNALINKEAYDNILLVIVCFISVLGIMICLKGYFDAVYDPKVTYIRYQFLSKFYHQCMTMKYIYTEDAEILNNIQKSCMAASSIKTGIAGLIRKSIDIFSSIIAVSVFFLLLAKLNILFMIILIVSTIIIYFLHRDQERLVYDSEITTNKHRRKVVYMEKLLFDIDYLKDIRIYNMSSWISSKFNDIIKSYIDFFAKIRRSVVKKSVIILLVAAIREVFMYGYLIYEVLAKNIGIAEFSMYLALVYQFSDIMINLFKNIAGVSLDNQQIDEFRSFLNLEGESTTDKLAKLNDSNHVIEFKNIYFKYPGTEQYIYENFNITFNPGEKIAIVGLNGTGKTTLIKLLCGLYEPEKGDIFIDGINVKNFTKEYYYGLFSVVFQDNKMLSFTFAENITLQTWNDLNETKLNKVINKVGLSQKVEQLKYGVNTFVDNHLETDGVQLSGGEVQKVVLARSLYKDGDFFILDEPTSALDPLAEHYFYNEFSSMTNGKTTIFVSHRLSSTRFCDRIILLDKGKIVEEGTHDDLLHLGGQYYYLYNLQSQYYKS